MNRSLTKSLRERLGDGSRSALRRYQDVVVGSTSLGYTLPYELVTGVGGLAQAPALFGGFTGNTGGPTFAVWIAISMFRITGMPSQMGSNPRETAIGDAFIIADHHAITLNEIVGAIAEALNMPPHRLRLPYSLLYAASAAVEFSCNPFSISAPLHRRRAAWFNSTPGVRHQQGAPYPWIRPEDRARARSRRPSGYDIACVWPARSRPKAQRKR